MGDREWKTPFRDFMDEQSRTLLGMPLDDAMVTYPDWADRIISAGMTKRWPGWLEEHS